MADGANVALEDVLALNVRTEIAFGLDAREEAPRMGCRSRLF